MAEQEQNQQQNNQPQEAQQQQQQIPGEQQLPELQPEQPEQKRYEYGTIEITDQAELAQVMDEAVASGDALEVGLVDDVLAGGQEAAKEAAEEHQKKGLDISAKSYITSLALIFALMVFTYILTLVLPAGEYARVLDANGNTVIDQVAGYHEVEGGIGFFTWLFSPFLVLGAEGSGTLIAVIIFLLVIGGVFNALDKCGLMKYMLEVISKRFGRARYKLMAVLVLFFMAMGSLIGSFEECVPLVPICVALSIALGWDRITGLAMSMLAVGCGFAAGVCNPFSVGVAQELAGLPMFSGMWLRVVAFVLIYALLMLFLTAHARKVERPVDAAVGMGFVYDPQRNRALVCFAVILGIGIAVVLCSPFIPALQDYTMIIVALMFLVAGIVAVKVAGVSNKELAATFGNGSLSLVPAIFMIPMASSIRFTLVEASVLDTILHGIVNVAGTLPQWSIILLIYLIALIMNFFVPSGTAKAFMLMPLFVPMAQLFGIPIQLCVVAYAFGDGFSNVFYPTNPALLISLGLAGIGYGEWFKWSWKFQLANLVLTSGILLFGLAVGYC